LNKHSPLITHSLRIRELDRRLERGPDGRDARFERAGLLREQGLFEEAKRDYLELLRRTPTDFGALNDFGTLALTAGYKDAARSLFNEAVRHHPDNPNGHVNLANLLFLSGEQEPARVHFETALRIDPDHIHAHRGMGNLWPSLATRPAPGGTGTRGSGIISRPHCRIAAMARRSRSCC
jgi:tetratricopeptide (TPR) repeat protein